MRKKGPIVIVDDDPDDQYLYVKALEKLNIDNAIVMFSNGQEALAYLKEAEPFLILCDINMPQMTGLQMREAMCNDQVLCKKNTPFIFMSTSARESDIRGAALLCTQGFFEKEVSFERHENLLKGIIDYWSSCRYIETQAA